MENENNETIENTENTETVENTEKVETKTFTQEEVDALLNNKIKEYEDKAKELDAKEKQLKLSETLVSKGLDKELSKYLKVDGIEDIEGYINEVSSVIQKHIVDNTIENSYKPKSHTAQKDSISKDDFMKMSYADRVNLFKSNEELYKRLSK